MYYTRKFGPKTRGFKSRAGYNGACTVPKYVKVVKLKCCVILKRHKQLMILSGRRRQDKTKHVSLTKGDMILMGLNFMDYVQS